MLDLQENAFLSVIVDDEDVYPVQAVAHGPLVQMIGTAIAIAPNDFGRCFITLTATGFRIHSQTIALLAQEHNILPQPLPTFS